MKKKFYFFILLVLFLFTPLTFADKGEEKMKKLFGMGETSNFFQNLLQQNINKNEQIVKVIVQTKNGSLEQRKQYFENLNLSTKQNNQYYVFKNTNSFATEITREDLNKLVLSSDIKYIYEDIVLHLSLTESLPQINGGSSFSSKYGETGEGQTIAILDGGFNSSHPFYSDRIVYGACFSSDSNDDISICEDGSSTQIGINAINCQSSYNCGFHGSHVTGIAAGNSSTLRGVAPSANLILINVFHGEINNDGDFVLGAYNSNIQKGLEKVNDLSLNYTISAVSMSLGSSYPWLYSQNCDSETPDITTEINSLKNNGIATIVASGNDENIENISFPACISTAFSVGSVDDYNYGSSQIDKVSTFSNSNSLIDFLAPGSLINSSSLNSFEIMGGTSMATPHVSGAWTVLKGAFPDATISQIETALKTTGKQITDTRNNVIKPRIDLGLALLYLHQQLTNVILDFSQTQNETQNNYIFINFTANDNFKINATLNNSNLNINKNYTLTNLGENIFSTNITNLCPENYTLFFEIFKYGISLKNESFNFSVKSFFPQTLQISPLQNLVLENKPINNITLEIADFSNLISLKNFSIIYENQTKINYPNINFTKNNSNLKINDIIFLNLNTTQNITFEIELEDLCNNTETYLVRYTVSLPAKILNASFTNNSNINISSLIYTAQLNFSKNITDLSYTINSQTTTTQLMEDSISFTITLPSYGQTNIIFNFIDEDGFNNSQIYNINFTLYLGGDETDFDNDGILDVNDKVIGNTSNIVTSGIENLSLEINGTNNLTKKFTNTSQVKFYENNTPLLEFAHNFSNSTLNLTNLKIIKNETGNTTSIIIGGASNVGSKIVYLKINSSLTYGLCVKDEEILQISQINQNCLGENEYNLGVPVVNSNINVSFVNETNTTIKIEGLRHSGILLQGRYIDKIPPTGSVSYSPTSQTTGNVIITVACSDNVACEKDTYTKTVTQNGNGNIEIKDTAGNSADIPYNVTNIIASPTDDGSTGGDTTSDNTGGGSTTVGGSPINTNKKLIPPNSKFLKNFNVLVVGEKNITSYNFERYYTLKEIEINLKDGKKLIKFSNNFSKNDLDLSKIEVDYNNKNKSNYIILKFFQVGEKEIYFKKILNNSELCLIEKNITTKNSFSSNCTNSNEVKLICSQENNCTLTNKTYTIKTNNENIAIFEFIEQIEKNETVVIEEEVQKINATIQSEEEIETKTESKTSLWAYVIFAVVIFLILDLLLYFFEKRKEKKKNEVS